MQHILLLFHIEEKLCKREENETATWMGKEVPLTNELTYFGVLRVHSFYDMQDGLLYGYNLMRDTKTFAWKER